MLNQDASIIIHRLGYIESARTVMKGIDLDPASSDELNKSIKASIHYTIEEDGLQQEWLGRVFLNPPWSGQAEKFVNLLLLSYRKRAVTRAVLLLPSAYVVTANLCAHCLSASPYV